MPECADAQRPPCRLEPACGPDHRAGCDEHPPDRTRGRQHRRPHRTSRLRREPRRRRGSPRAPRRRCRRLRRRPQRRAADGGTPERVPDARIEGRPRGHRARLRACEPRGLRAERGGPVEPRPRPPCDVGGRPPAPVLAAARPGRAGARQRPPREPDRRRQADQHRGLAGIRPAERARHAPADRRPGPRRGARQRRRGSEAHARPAQRRRAIHHVIRRRRQRRARRPRRRAQRPRLGYDRPGRRRPHLPRRGRCHHG